MLSCEEIGWLKAHYPDLDYDAQCHQIFGELPIRMFYSEKSRGEYVINPDKSYELLEGTLIEDVYEIEIRLEDSIVLPEVREVGGRIAKSLAKWNIKNPADLHVYTNGALCLCIPVEIDQKFPYGFNLKDFFWKLLVPYFYYQSYFEKFGLEPWLGYGHGDMGILESFQNRVEGQNNVGNDIIKLYLESLSREIRLKIIANIKLKGHHRCLCGSGKISRKCHKKAFWGYNQLKKLHHANFE